MATTPASATLPDWLRPGEVLPTLLDVSLTGVLLLRPVYAAGEGGEVVDFTFALLNAAAQAMLQLPAHPAQTLRVTHPHVVATGVFEFYRAAFEQGEASQLAVNYQHDGLDNYFEVAARRSGPVLVVSLTDTAGHPRTAVEEALRASQASERAMTNTLLHTNAELLRTQQQLEQLNEQLESRVQERTHALGRAQALAERQRTRLEQFFRQAHAAICVLSGPDMVHELVNARYQALFPGRELLGKPLLETQPQLASQPIWQVLRRVYETGETAEGFGIYMPIPTQVPGEVRELYFNYIHQARYNEQGEVDGLLICAFDVTEQVLARQQADALQAEALTAARQLAAQRASFHQVFEQTPAPICLLRGPQYVLEYCNPAFQALYAGRDLLGRPVAESQPEAVAQGFTSLLDKVYYSGQTYQATEVLGWVTPPGGGPPQERYFSFTYQPIWEEGQLVGVSVFAFEVTGQVLARRQLQRVSRHLEVANEQLAAYNTELLVANTEVQHTNQELAAANQLLLRTTADLDNFIYTASHDLRTPITNIEGLLRALRTELPPASQVADVPYILELMQESINRFKRTVVHLTDILRLQKESEQAPEAVYLADIIRDVRLDLTSLVEKIDVRLDVNIRTYPVLNFSKKNLRSIVYNLLSNAIKYRSPSRVPHVRVRCYHTPGYLVLEVRDNGLGLDLTTMPRLFGLFQRFHTHVEGSGIGLYMVKRILENAGGKIEVQSQLGVGSTFSAYFRH